MGRCAPVQGAGKRPLVASKRSTARSRMYSEALTLVSSAASACRITPRFARSGAASSSSVQYLTTLAFSMCQLRGITP